MVHNGTTELDSHANMVVIGAIIQNTGKYADVNGFSPDVDTMPRVPNVDAVLGYDCPISGKTTLLVATNALFVESMDHNLILPFIMREAGLETSTLYQRQWFFTCRWYNVEVSNPRRSAGV